MPQDNKSKSEEIPEMNLDKKYSNKLPEVPENADKIKKDMEKVKKELEKLKKEYPTINWNEVIKRGILRRLEELKKFEELKKRGVI